METIAGILGALLVLALGLWFGKRQFEHNEPPELLEAMRVEKSDPARAEFLTDQYFTKGAAREEAERRELWERAPNDISAAEELRRRLRGDLEADAEIQREFRNSDNAELMRTLEASQQSTREQIAKLDGIISRIRVT